MDDSQKPQFSGLKVDTGKKTKHYLYYWEEIRTPHPHPSRRCYHSMATWRNKLIVIGGQDLREGPQSGIWILSISENSSGIERWEDIDVLNGYLYRSAALVHNDDLYLVGGTDGKTEFNTLMVMNLVTRKISHISPSSNNCPPPIDSHTATLHGDSILVFGGFIAGNRSNNLYLFSIPNKEWTEIPTSDGPCPRSNHSAVIHNGHLFIFGGSDEEGEKLNDLWGLNLDTYQWRMVDSSGTVPSPRSGHTAVMFNHIMVIFGGMKDITKETNEMFSFDFKTHTWVMFQSEHQIKDPITAEQLEEFKKSRSPAKSGSPAAFRRSLTSVGEPKSPVKTVQQSKSPLKRQGTFNDNSPGDSSPRRKKKAPPSLYDGPPAPLVGRVRGSAPHPRDGHGAVLLGNSMIIFGGDRHQMPFNDIYIYSMNEEVMRTTAE